MLSLSVDGLHAPSGRREPMVESDPISILSGRLRSLLDAECVFAVKCNLRRSTAEVIATVGRANDIQGFETAVLGLARRLDAVQPRSGSPNGMEIVRSRLDAEHGEALIIKVKLVGASLLFIATHNSDTLPFTTNAERAVRRMSEWIGDYTRLWWRQQSDRHRGDSLHAALDLVGVALFVLDGKGQPIIANHAARLLLEAGDGLRNIGGMLIATSLEDSARLQTAIAHASTRETGNRQWAPLLAIRREGLRPLSVAVMRGSTVGASTGAGDSLVVIQAVDPHCDIESALLPVCAVYNLTGAEARLAKLLIGGGVPSRGSDAVADPGTDGAHVSETDLRQDWNQSPVSAGPPDVDQHRTYRRRYRTVGPAIT